MAPLKLLQLFSGYSEYFYGDKMDVALIFGETTSLDKVARLAYTFGHVAKDIAYLERLPADSPLHKDYINYTKPSFALSG